MKTIKTTFVLLCIALGFSLNAQNVKQKTFEIDTTKQNEFEIDVTNLIKSVIVTSGFGQFNSLITSPYLLTYRRYIKNFDVHAGFGLNGLKTNRTTNDTLSDNRNQFSFDIGLGFSHYTAISNRFKLYYGSDLIGGFTTENTEFDFRTNDGFALRTSKRNEYRVGLRPFLGIQFYLSKNISLATETALNVSYFSSKSTDKIDYINSVIEDDENTVNSNGITTGYTIPLNIRLRVRF